MKKKRKAFTRTAAVFLAALFTVSSVDLSVFTAYAAQSMDTVSIYGTKVSHLDDPAVILYNGVEKKDWYTTADGNVVITADGYTISDTPNGDYQKSYVLAYENDGECEKTLYFKDASGQMTDGVEVSVQYDRTAPAFPSNGGIVISQNKWKSFLHTITFGTFFKEDVEVKVVAKDSTSGIARYFYYVDKSGDESALTAEQLADVTFTEKTDSKIDTITAEGRYVYYVYVEDNAGNRSGYICSNGVVVDKTAPVVSGASCEAEENSVRLTITAEDAGSGIDQYYLLYPYGATIQYDGEDIVNDATMSGTSGCFELSGLSCGSTYPYMVVVTDKAGNISEIYKDTFTTPKGKLHFETSDLPTISGTYGDTLGAMTLSDGGEGTYNLDGATVSVPGTWSIAEEDKDTIYPTVNGTAYRVTFTPDYKDGMGIPREIFDSYTAMVTPAVAPKELGFTVTATDRAFEPNADKVDITVTLSGIVNSDTVEVADSASLQATISGPDAGTYDKVTLPELVLTGVDKDNYMLSQTAGDYTLSASVRIDKGTYEPQTITKQYYYAKDYVNEMIQLSDYLPEGYGTENPTYTITDLADNGILEDVSISNGELTYKIKASAVSGIFAHITVKVSTKNYDDFYIDVTIEQIAQMLAVLKENTSVTLKNSVLIYGEPLSELQFDGAFFVSRDEPAKEITGTLAWETPDTKPDVGTYRAKWVFTPDASYGEAYAGTEGYIEITVNKAVPYIDGVPAAEAITYGQALEDSKVQGQVYYDSSKAMPAAGSFVWEDKSIVPTAKTDSDTTLYTVIFKPEDSTNYSEAATQITITVGKAPNPSNMPASTQSVPYSCKMVGAVELPEGWEWGTYQTGDRTIDKTITLEAGVPVTAEAVYTGADQGNYVTESVRINITRSSCEHVAGETLYTGTGEHAPDCVNTGLGHTECTKCHEVLKNMISAAKLGHDYKAEVTTLPTAASTGVRTYTCKRCGHTYTETIAKLQEEAHKHNYTAAITREADCVSEGIRTYSCSCGDSYTEAIPALGHHYAGRVTKEADASQEGIMTYTCDKCGHSYTRPIAKPDNGRPDTGTPYIEGKEDKNGWDTIRKRLEKVKEKNTLTIDMNGAAVVPGDIFNTMKGRDVNVVFDMGEGIFWTVNGKDITADKINDIDFGVETGVQAGKTIPEDLINNVSGERSSMNLTLAYDGAFGFEAVLTLKTDKKNAWLFANLFYYDPGSEELGYMCADLIDKEGNAELTFTHASDYVIVIDEEDMEDMVTDTDAGSEEEITQTPADDITANTDKTTRNPLWGIVIGAVLMIAGLDIFLIRRMKY